MVSSPSIELADDAACRLFSLYSSIADHQLPSMSGLWLRAGSDAKSIDRLSFLLTCICPLSIRKFSP
jgi:hypothetical protein